MYDLSGLLYNNTHKYYEIVIDGVKCRTGAGFNEETAKITLDKYLKNFNELNSIGKNRAASDLLTLKNKDWLADEEKELTKSEFKKKMDLTDIIFRKNHIELWYNDHNLFFGHSIVVDCDLECNPTNCEIVG